MSLLFWGGGVGLGQKCSHAVAETLWGSALWVPALLSGHLLIPCSSSITRVKASRRNGVVPPHGSGCHLQSGERRGIKQENSDHTFSSSPSGAP